MSKKKKKLPIPQLPDDVWAIDSHCHLDMDAYDDCDLVIKRAVEAGVRHIITIGIDLPSSEAALKLAGKYPSLSCAVGIHPHSATDVDRETGSRIKKMVQNKDVLAIGEIGLDYAKNYADKDTQIHAFRYQLELAKELNLPVIIHDREAHDDVMDILGEFAPFPAGGVMHCFSGDKALALEVIKLGFYISVPGVVTFKNARTLQEAVRVVPLESLILETDGPFLTPAPYRGHRNEPSYMLYTAEKVAELKGMKLADLVRQTTLNTQKLFSKKLV